MKPHHLISLAILLVSVVTSAPAAMTWNAGLDLSANEKPDGPQELINPNATVPEWSYGYRESAASLLLTLFSPSDHTNGGVQGFDGWGSLPLIYANVTGAPVSNVGPDELLMHPVPEDAVGTYVVARWTAPTHGEFNIATDWRDVNPGGTGGFSAYFVLNGVSIFAANVGEGLSTSDARTLSLNTGDFLDFVVGPGPDGNFTFDSTAVRVTVVPEPASVIMLVLGCSILLRRRSLCVHGRNA